MQLLKQVLFMRELLVENHTLFVSIVYTGVTDTSFTVCFFDIAPCKHVDSEPYFITGPVHCVCSLFFFFFGFHGDIKRFTAKINVNITFFLARTSVILNSQNRHNIFLPISDPLVSTGKLELPGY